MLAGRDRSPLRPRTAAFTVAAVFAFGALQPSCSEPPPNARPSPRAPASPPPRDAAPDTGPIGDDAAPQTTTAPPVDPTMPQPIPARLGAPGSTRGTVACGDARCPAPGQACFLDDANTWVCRPVEPIDARDAMDTFEDLGLRCDDGFDCPDGETCCTTFGAFRRVCVKRAEVGALCLAEVCLEGGAKCPPGRVCSAQDGQEGSCEAPDGPATCAGKRPCPAGRPICVVADEGPRCVAEGTPEHDAVPGSRRYRCTRQSDCHLGDTCQYVFGEIDHAFRTYCGSYARGFMGSAVCDPTVPPPCAPGDADCADLNRCHAPEPGAALPWLGVL